MEQNYKGYNTPLWGNGSSPNSTEQWVTWSCRSVAEERLGEGSADDFSDARNINLFLAHLHIPGIFRTRAKVSSDCSIKMVSLQYQWDAFIFRNN